MKLIIAIVQDEDSQKFISEMMKAGFSITKLATTGGFLRIGNTTMMIGVDESRVEEALDMINHICKSRKQVVTSPSPMAGTTGVYIPYPVEVSVGGATVFVLDVEQFKKF